MAPLVGGEWSEAKTLVLGVIEKGQGSAGQQEAHARELSYFSRVCEAQEFQHAALVETQRRGVENAGCVIAPLDGAEWEQKFLDYHRPDAVRILDFAHAAEYLGKIGAALWGIRTPMTQAWLSETLHRLKKQEPGTILPGVRDLVASSTSSEEVLGCLEYLEKREAQMQYPFYQAQGWPLGSGAVESANKVVVEARLKGAGDALGAGARQPNVGTPQRGVQRPLGGSLAADRPLSPARAEAATRDPLPAASSTTVGERSAARQPTNHPGQRGGGLCTASSSLDPALCYGHPGRIPT